MQNLLNKQWHCLQVNEVLEQLKVKPDFGLEESEVLERQQAFGANRLSQKKGQSPFMLFLSQFNQPLIYLLLAATVITAFLQEWVDSSVIFGVVLVNAVIGFVQESKALKAIDALSKTMDTEATVIRAGYKQRIPASELVVGDIVVLQSGDKVPADMRLIRSRELQVAESALTGESVPVQKQIDSLLLDTVLADRKNMAYSSTLVTYGTATGVVVAIGDQTEIGRINELISAAEVLATPLTKKIEQFSKMLLWAILTIAMLTVGLGLFRGDPLLDIFMATVALAVASIPEGLPAAMTIMLAIGVSKMAARHAIIRKLPAVETLGSTSVICSDKTGTLTQNQMTVENILAGNKMLTVTGGGYAPSGEFLCDEKKFDPKTHETLMECLRAGLLCSDARLINTDEGWKIEGDPTEGALITSAVKAGLSIEALHESMPRIDSIPFESEHQYMATLHDKPQSSSRIIFLKGSVEQVLARCKDTLEDGNRTLELNTDEVHRHVVNMTAKGLRVLAFAKLEIPKTQEHISHEDVSGGLTFLGLQGMIDPLRPEVVASVCTCQKAGIRVKMITGDHIGTAVAIAEQLGLQTNGTKKVKALSGRELETLSDEELIEEAETTAVFARVAPEQKLRLVEALQTKNYVTAMTGDGVNDAPALRQSNIGIAMGITGTEVAKEAADMVLTDDNFSTIEAAVEEGRSVYDNLVKFITWTLPTNLGEALVILVAIFAGVGLPITPVQILWINMTTAIFLGLMLAFEQKEPRIMARLPRNPKEHVLTPKLIFRIFLVGIMLPIGAFGLYNWELSHGESEAVARAVAVNMFVFGELFYLFNCRSLTYSMFKMGVFSNGLLLLGVAGMILAQLLLTYAPFMNVAFGTAPLGLEEWALIVAASFVIYLIIELEKFIQRSLSTERLKA